MEVAFKTKSKGRKEEGGKAGGGNKCHRLRTT
jgi:hypothetical protein